VLERVSFPTGSAFLSRFGRNLQVTHLGHFVLRVVFHQGFCCGDTFAQPTKQCNSSGRCFILLGTRVVPFSI
jgi:hypothetical protein